MYAVALLLAGTTTAGTTGLPYFHLGALNIGIPIQSFGVIVALGVLIGAALLRRYAEWHGVSDDHIRGITGWITVSGFIGAHLFDVLFYQWHDLEQDPLLLFKVWAGISSYGGFLGGAIGFALYTWWKRVDVRLFADIAVIGLLPAFSIGRIGCTVVSDHIGAAVDPNAWYSGLAMDYPRNLNLGGLNDFYPGTTEFIRAWNLGLVELLYLVPVNALILWLAFRSKKRPNAGLLVVLTGVLYAPVRFGLDFLRPETSDPRYAGLTFAQWSSLLMFGVAVYVAGLIFRTGKPAETITTTSGEAQARLKVVLKGDDSDVDDDASTKKKGDVKKPAAKKAEPKAVEKEKELDEVAKALAAVAARKADPTNAPSDDDDDMSSPKKKTNDKKADEKKADDKKADDKKADDKKADEKMADEKKAEEKAEAKAEKIEAKLEKAEDKAEAKAEKAEAREKAEAKKADDKEAEEKAEKAEKTEEKKAEKAEEKKPLAEAEEKKTDEKKAEPVTKTDEKKTDPDAKKAE